MIRSPQCKALLLAIMLSPFCAELSLSAQSTRADSLFAIWSDSTNTPEARVEAFYQRFNPLRDEASNPETLRWVPGLAEVQELAMQTGKTDYLGRFQMLEGGYYFLFTSNKERGCVIAKKAFYNSLEAKDHVSANWALSMLGQCNYQNVLDIEEEVPGFYEVLLSHVDTTAFSNDQIMLYLALADYYYGNSQFPDALRLYHLVIEYSRELDITNFSYNRAILSSGSIHSNIGNFPEAEQYLLESLETSKTLQNNPMKAATYIELAQNYERMSDLESATAYLDSALHISQDDVDCTACIKRAYRVRGSIENQAGNYRKALEELLPLMDYYEHEAATSRENFRAYFFELSIAYLGLRQYQQAIAMASKGVAEKHFSLYGPEEGYEVISQAYTALGNYRLALENYRNYVAARDARINFRNSQQVTRLELESQYEQQRLADSLQVEQQRLESELLLQAELGRQKTNRNIVIALGLLSLLLALGLFYRLRLIRRTEAALREKNAIIEREKEKAKTSERAKHQFLANMSHEIRTPMNAIKGMTDILIRRDPKPEQREYLSGIRQSSDSLLVIINDILDLSKIEAGKIELERVPFSVDELLREVLMIMQFRAEEKGLELKVKLPADLPLVEGDPTRLRQILINLTGNAIKFTEKGIVSIMVEPESRSTEQLALRFTVSDTGIGIDPDRLEKIFRSFEQAYSDTNRKFGGTGLGLSISKKLVELQGGAIRVESEKGQGSRFLFTIAYPIVQTALPTATEASGTSVDELAQDLAGTRILLVEDNTFNAIVAKEELEDAIRDIQVELAENGAIAVEKVKTENYHLILMDVQMPVMNGYEATARIRALDNGGAAIPIIAMTANVMKEEVEHCYAAGMNDFIGKPFDTGELLHKMADLIAPKLP